MNARVSFFGTDHPQTVYSLSVLVVLCRSAGQYEEATQLSDRVFFSNKRLCGTYHISILILLTHSQKIICGSINALRP